MMDQQQLAAWALDRAIETAKITPGADWTAQKIQDAARSFVDFVADFKHPIAEERETEVTESEVNQAVLKAVQ